MTNSAFLQRLATRMIFAVAGIGMSVWAALVPFAKTRMHLGAAELGLLLLFLGVGSLVAMPLTGILAARFGCRPVILTGGVLGCLALPVLSVAPTAPLQAVVLMLFGAAIGTLDVAMNIHAVIVEKANGRALMSGFHGFFSIGGVIGAGGMSVLLGAGTSPLAACGVVTALMSFLLGGAAPFILKDSPDSANEGVRLAAPHGVVIVIGLLCFALFLAEGAVLDWSALLLTTSDGLASSQGGTGYAVFAAAMTIGRLSGDGVIRAWGRKRVLLGSGVCTAGGFFTAALTPLPQVALLGFILVGVGAANIVPILFTAAGRQKDMPASIAVSAVTTIGYAGVLIGPALIGFVAHASSLQVAFAVLGGAMLLVAASGWSSII